MTSKLHGVASSVYVLSEADLADKPVTAGVLLFADREHEETLKWLRQLKAPPPSLPTKSSRDDEKIVSAINLTVNHIHQTVLKDVDDNYFDPSQANLEAAALSYAFSAFVVTALYTGVINEGFDIQDSLKDSLAQIISSNFPLFPDDKILWIYEQGKRLFSTISDSREVNAIELKEKITDMSLAFAINARQNKVPQDNFDRIFKGLFASLYGALETKGQ